MNTQEQEVVIRDEAMQMAIAIHDSFIRTPNYELSMTRIAMMIDEVKRQARKQEREELIKEFNPAYVFSQNAMEDMGNTHVMRNYYRGRFDAFGTVTRTLEK